MTDDERLQEIKARCERATEGPWSLWNGWQDGEFGYALRIGPDEPYEGLVASDKSDIQGTVGDLEFVASARADVPFLVVQLEASQQQVAELQDKVDRHTILREELDHQWRKKWMAQSDTYSSLLETERARVAELQAENGRLRMRAEVGRSVCPYCGGEEYHLSECELEGGQL